MKKRYLCRTLDSLGRLHSYVLLPSRIKIKPSFHSYFLETVKKLKQQQQEQKGPTTVTTTTTTIYNNRDAPTDSCLTTDLPHLHSRWCALDPSVHKFTRGCGSVSTSACGCQHRGTHWQNQQKGGKVSKMVKC